ncbi:MAG: DMT family transporter [Ignavibacteria bacterium]|nr:DMT family transporter [Ignavibacteria bacterium]
MKSWKAELLLLVITIIWGGTFAFTKIGLEYATPFLLISLRFFVALLTCLILWNKIFFNITPKILSNGLILGIFYAGGFALQTLGLNYTTVTKSAFISGLFVILTPFAYKLIDKNKISIYQWVGVLIVLVGLWLFTNPGINNVNIGDVLTLLSTFFWAFYIVYINKFTKDVEKFSETIQLVIAQFLVVWIIGLIGFLAFELKSFKFSPNTNLLIVLLYNGIIASVLLTAIHTGVQKYSTPVKAALIFSLEPVFASIFAIIIFQEYLKLIEYLGALFILFGVVFSEIGDYFLSKGIIFRRK